MNVTKEEVEAGQAAYTPRLLGLYDFLVIRFTIPYIWRCPVDNLLSLYNKHLSSNHLDIGVGSGYFLDNCNFPSENPRLALMDLNPNSLKFSSERVLRYKPELFTANILEPLETNIEKFDSVGINAVIHCLPGTMETKLVIFDHIKTLLNPGGVVFGSTILNIGVKQNWLTKKFMTRFNKQKYFCNLDDGLATLKDGLNTRFSESEVNVIGAFALFKAKL